MTRRATKRGRWTSRMFYHDPAKGSAQLASEAILLQINFCVCVGGGGGGGQTWQFWSKPILEHELAARGAKW